MRQLLVLLSATAAIAQTLGVAPNAIRTVLTANVGLSDTTISVAACDKIVPGQMVNLDYEMVFESSVNYTTCALAVTRSYGGTTAARHYTGAIVSAYPYTANSTSVAVFGVVGDGTTNNTAGILAAITAANGNEVYFPPGSYAVTSINLTTSGSVTIRCAGPKSTTLIRHSSALQASTPLLKITNAAKVQIRDCGFDELGNGTNYTNAASTVYLSNVGSATIDNTYSTHSQANAFLLDCVSDVSFTNNSSYQNWNAGFADAGCGTVSSPTVIHRITANGNRCEDEPVCLQVTGFADTITMNSNVATKAAFGAAVQDVNYFAFTGNVAKGSHTYGLVVNLDCFFFEGPTNFNISGNVAADCTQNGIFVQGTELTIGTTEQLPVKKGTIANNHIDNPGAAGISVIGQSFDHSLQGTQIGIEGNHITNATTGLIIGAVTGFDASYNYIDGIGTNGIELSIVKNGIIKNNTITNVSKLTPNTYYGIKIGNDSTTFTLDLDISRNVIIDTLGNMRGGVNNDALGTGGYQNLVRHCGNTIRGAVAGQWFPAPAVPTTGAWLAGDCIENFSLTNGIAEWRAIAGGTPGTWVPVAIAPGATTYANNAAAVTGGLSVGALYRVTSADTTNVVH